MITIKRAGLLSELRLLGFSEEELAEMQAVGVSDNFLQSAIELHRELQRDLSLIAEDLVDRQKALRLLK